MKYLLLLAALFAVSTASYKQSMLETNRVTEAEEEQVGFATSCDECQSVIHQIVEAAKDPKKLEELKLVLGLLCKETSYAEECRLFVSQLDRFIDKLAPYLKDARAICQRIHICGNPKINAFRRILLDYARRTDKVISGPQIVCDECEFAIKELKQALENKDWQVQVRDFLRNNICKTLGSYRGFCDLVVDEYLPQFIQQADAVLSDPHQVCIDIHACPSTSFTPARKYVGLLGYIQRHGF